MKDKYKILYLEDVPTDAELVTAELKESNIDFELLVIDSETDYIKALATFFPDIILSDHSLPGFSSFEALKIVRARKITIPFIVITATMTEELAISIVREGAADYIMKDRLKRLPHAVINAVEKFRFEKERKQLIDEVYAKEALSIVAIKVSRAKFRRALHDLEKIMDSSLDIICSLDEEGRFVTVSAAAETVLGYKPAELTGKKYIDFVFKDDVGKTIDSAISIKNGTPVTIFENRYIHKNGRRIPMLWSAKWDENDKIMYCIAKDASEKKKLEKAFESERQRFHDLFLQAPTSMGILKGPSHIFETANPLYLQLIGKKDIIGKAVKEVMPELAAQGFIELLDLVYKTGETFRANEMLVKLDQHGNGKLIEKYLNFIYQAYRNADDVIEGIFFFAVDVTEQVLSHKKIEESENRFREIFNSVPEALVIFDAITGKFINFNNNAIGMFKYPAKEFIKKGPVHISPLFQKDGRSSEEKASEFTSDALNGDRPVFEWLFVDANGKEILCEVRLTMLYNSNIPELLGSFIDITERKNDEEQMKQLTNRLLLATKSAGMGIWDWDIPKDHLNWDKGMYQLYEINESQFGSIYEGWLSRLHPEDNVRVRKDIQMAITDKKEYHSEFRIVWSDSSVHYIKATGITEKDDKGNVIRLIGVNWDITARKLTEINLKELNENLQKHTKELALSNAELEQFAYVASHDLQEPLRMVTSFLTQLEKKYGNVIDDKGKKYIGFAVDGAKRMRQIILDLLEFSRVGRMEDEQEELDLNELLTEIKILLRKKIEDKKAVIVIAPLPQIHAHRSPMRQVFQNLISNALKYSSNEIPVLVHIAVKEFTDHWQFAVTDNGIGIEKEYFDKIFIIFQRLHNKDEYSGTGMGLAITKKIIEAEGGKIWVESEEGKGSSFYFTIKK